MKHVNAALHVRDAYVTGEPGNPNTEGGTDVSPSTAGRRRNAKARAAMLPPKPLKAPAVDHAEILFPMQQELS
jgi:hypothetical protein